MPQPSLSQPLSSSHYQPPATSPLPTPPSSTSAIPTQCFPSPTSVADIATIRPYPAHKHPNVRSSSARPNPSPSTNSPNLDLVPPNSSDTSSPDTTDRSIPPRDHPPSRHPRHPSSQTSPSPSRFSETMSDANHPRPRPLPTHSADSHPQPSTTQSQSPSFNPPSAPQSAPHSSISANSEAPATASTPPLSQITTPCASISSFSSLPTPPPSFSRPSYFSPHLANRCPSPSLPPVSKIQLAAALSSFTSAHPSAAPIPDPPAYVADLRILLDHLDSLSEQLPLRQNNDLFQALASPTALHYLLFLLSDTSNKSEQASKDVRKLYRYPYLVSAMLANGSMVIRETFMAQSELVHHLLSFIDGDVPLHPSASQLHASSTSRALSRHNPVIILNVVQILVSYLDTNPDALLRLFESRVTWIPALVNLLHIGAVPKLLIDIIPDASVHEMATNDNNQLQFHSSLSSGLITLANAKVFHLLADAFVRAAQTIFSSEDANDEHTHQAQQLAYNITDVFDGILTKIVRAIRVHPRMAACTYLNVYGNASTAETLAHIVRAATHLFRETGFAQSAFLSGALSLLLRALRILQQDRDLRVASVMGPPPPLQTLALEGQMRPVLQSLIDLLIDLVGSKDVRHSTVRLHILDVFVEFCRIASEDTLRVIHKMRFGEIALRMVMLYPQNSLLHHVVCRGVEDALISRTATRETVEYWLVRARLPHNVVLFWQSNEGSKRWKDPAFAKIAPFLSAVVHMACCIHHWMAMEDRNGCVGNVLRSDVSEGFKSFWEEHMSPIMADETPLGGCKPRKRGARGGFSVGMSFGLGGSSGRLVRWSGASRNFGSGSGDTSGGGHLVRSGSAHRFGFVESVNTLRSRFDDVFVEGEEDFGECESVASLFDVGDGLS